MRGTESIERREDRVDVAAGAKNFARESFIAERLRTDARFRRTIGEEENAIAVCEFHRQRLVVENSPDPDRISGPLITIVRMAPSRLIRSGSGRPALAMLNELDDGS